MAPPVPRWLTPPYSIGFTAPCCCLTDVFGAVIPINGKETPDLIALHTVHLHFDPVTIVGVDYVLDLGNYGEMVGEERRCDIILVWMRQAWMRLNIGSAGPPVSPCPSASHLLAS